MATSFVALLPPEPVLSPTRQPAGSPARSRASPVLQPTSHAVSRAREAGASASPSSRLRGGPAIATGVVVSRGSPGAASFNSVSRRSSRVTGSPSSRIHAVSPAGPPKLSSIRLPAVLSLRVTAASQIASMVIPASPACGAVAGE